MFVEQPMFFYTYIVLSRFSSLKNAAPQDSDVSPMHTKLYQYLPLTQAPPWCRQVTMCLQPVNPGKVVNISGEMYNVQCVLLHMQCAVCSVQCACLSV